MPVALAVESGLLFPDPHKNAPRTAWRIANSGIIPPLRKLISRSLRTAWNAKFLPRLLCIFLLNNSDAEILVSCKGVGDENPESTEMHLAEFLEHFASGFVQDFLTSKCSCIWVIWCVVACLLWIVKCTKLKLLKNFFFMKVCVASEDA